MDELKELAARIRELREVCGYTQEELAKELHIDVDTYRGYEESAASAGSCGRTRSCARDRVSLRTGIRGTRSKISRTILRRRSCSRSS